jgi:hypothetical protein
MYDNIDCVLYKDKTPRLNNTTLLDYVPQFLSNTSLHYFNEGKDCAITGYLDTLKVSVSKRTVKIKDSSLCKWWLKENISTMFRGDIESSFEKISDLIHLPMVEADVTRLDIATNFVVKYDSSLYYDSLGTLKNYTRSPLGTGIYYNGCNGKLVFYDKLLDAKAKGMEIPTLYAGKNLLRYERRYQQRICKQLNRSELKVKTLYEEKFYIDIIDRWGDSYKAINKIKDIKKIDYQMIKTKTELYNQALLYYIEGRGGLVVVLDELKQAQKGGHLNKHQAQDLRNKYSEVSNNKLYVQDNELILELDNKVNQVLKHYR